VVNGIDEKRDYGCGRGGFTNSFRDFRAMGICAFCFSFASLLAECDPGYPVLH